MGPPRPREISSLINASRLRAPLLNRVIRILQLLELTWPRINNWPPPLPLSISTKEMVDFNKDLHPCIRVIDVHNPTPTNRIVACDFGKKNAPRIVIGLVFQRERERKRELSFQRAKIRMNTYEFLRGNIYERDIIQRIRGKS